MSHYVRRFNKKERKYYLKSPYKGYGGDYLSRYMFVPAARLPRRAKEMFLYGYMDCAS